MSEACLLDIISNGGAVLAAKTLSERVLSNFSRVRIKKTSVKVPKLKLVKGKAAKQNRNKKKDSKIPVSSIINILIKTAVENAKNGKKEKKAEESKSYTIPKEDDAQIINGGYGAVAKGYGSAPHTSYVDYGKLFSYLGKFKAQSPYDNMAEHISALNNATESGSFELVDRETMEKGKFYLRYVNSKIPIDKTSLVPIAGMNSAEWEQFKWFMRLDTAMYLLKISTS